MPAREAEKFQKSDWLDQAQELANEIADKLNINFDGLVSTLGRGIKDAFGTAAARIRAAWRKLMGRPAPPAQDNCDTANAGAEAYARERAAEMVGKQWKDGVLVPNPDARWTITESTREALKELIVDALVTGKSTDELSKEIEGLPEEEGKRPFNKRRAQTIARTELGQAYAYGSREAAKACGATKHASELSPDHGKEDEDECDIATADGIIPIDQPFSNGEMGPLYHPRCKCTERFYFPDNVRDRP